MVFDTKAMLLCDDYVIQAARPPFHCGSSFYSTKCFEEKKYIYEAWNTCIVATTINIIKYVRLWGVQSLVELY